MSATDETPTSAGLPLRDRIAAFQSRLEADRQKYGRRSGPEPTTADMRAQQLLDILEAQLPVEYRSADLVGLPDGPAAAATRGWATEPNGRNCIHIGQVGAGKTWAAAAQARAVASRLRMHVRWLTCAELFAGLRPEGGMDRRPVLTAGVLVLDEFGARPMSAWEHNLLGEIADYRAGRHLPIVTTTNLTVAQIRDALDPMIYSRLVFTRPGAGAAVIRWKGTDRRRGCVPADGEEKTGG